MMKILALTGGIASGKTTVARMFEDFGATVFYADKIAHGIYQPGTPSFKKIVRRFGRKIIGGNGAIDREKLAGILFRSKKEKKWLEALIHPATRRLIGKKITAAIRKRPPLILVEAALHLETGYHLPFQGLIVVHVTPRVQRQRLMKRDRLTPQQARLRIHNQFPLNKKKKMADWVIDNSGPLAKTKTQVTKLYRQLISK